MSKFWISEDDWQFLFDSLDNDNINGDVMAILARIKEQPLPDEKAEPEKWEWLTDRDGIRFRNINWNINSAFDQVLQELADARAEIERLKKITEPQQPPEMVCSGCGIPVSKWKYGAFNSHFKKDLILADDSYCGHAIPKSEYKGEQK